jgi:hypothetical protein
MTGGQLRVSWSELVRSSSGYCSVLAVSAPFWHANGMVDLDPDLLLVRYGHHDGNGPAWTVRLAG